MTLDIDVLILYAENDNTPLRQKEVGWVSQFNKFLEMMLLQVLGHKPHIVMLSEEDSTSAAIDNASLLICVLSNSFIESGKCLDAMESFFANIKKPKPNTENPQRIFKILKTKLASQSQPRRIRELIGYDMYQTDIETTEVTEYTDFFTQEAEKQFWMKLVDLTYDINESLLTLKGEKNGKNVDILKRKTIYLAETSHDLNIQRNIIRRELQRYGYHVLPSRMLPGNISDFQTAVKNNLKKCDFSIHLIGKAYGEIPEGATLSITEIQNQLATETAMEKNRAGQQFSRLVWIAPAMNNLSERQQTFISLLIRETEDQVGAEVLQNPIEDFKNLMREELLEAYADKFTEIPGRSFYLVYDKVDEGEIGPLREVIEKEGFQVLEPLFDHDLMAVRNKHSENLKNMDAALIFKGKVNEQWVRMKVLDLLKAPGFGRSKPILGKAVATTGDDETSLKVYKDMQVEVISANLKQMKDLLQNFIREL